MIIPVRVEEKTTKVLIRGQKRDVPTGRFVASVFVDGKWKQIKGSTRDHKSQCMGDIHKWAGDRGLWFDRGQMKVKGTVLK